MNGIEDDMFNRYGKISELLDHKKNNIDDNYINHNENKNSDEEEYKDERGIEFNEVLDNELEDKKELEDEFNYNIELEGDFNDNKGKEDEAENYLNDIDKRNYEENSYENYKDVDYEILKKKADDNIL